MSKEETYETYLWQAKKLLPIIEKVAPSFAFMSSSWKAEVLRKSNLTPVIGSNCEDEETAKRNADIYRTRYPASEYIVYYARKPVFVDSPP